MFMQMRYQTGEVLPIIEEMKNGSIPCLEVIDNDEFESFTESLIEFGIRKSDTPYDRNARDGIKEPEFEFRAAFHPVKTVMETHMPDIMYIDVYFEPEFERTYDSVGEM